MQGRPKEKNPSKEKGEGRHVANVTKTRARSDESRLTRSQFHREKIREKVTLHKI